MLSHNTTFCPPDHHTISDDTLIARIRLQDQYALGLLYCRYYRLVYTVALRVLRDTRSAEETSQDVFQIVWQSAHSFQTGRNLPGWLSRVARNRAIDLVRTRRYRAHTQETQLAEELIPTSYSEFSHTSLIRLTVRSALSTLSPKQRHVIELAYFGGFTQEEIARHLGEPLGTIKARMQRGLTKLRGVLNAGVGYQE